MIIAYAESFRASQGILTVVATDRGVAHVDFDAGGRQRAREAAGRYQRAPGMPFPARRQILEYLSGKRRAFDLPLHIEGSLHQRKVWSVLRSIPFGGAVLMHELAWRVGIPKGYRAVNAALMRNPLPILVPCHRVMTDEAGTYIGGTEWKRVLLEREGIDPTRFAPPQDDG